MPKRSSTGKKDLNQLAFSIVQRSTAEKPPEDQGEAPEVSEALDNEDLRKEIMREMGRRGGKKGGKARAEKLTAEQRSEIAKKAAEARWKSSS